MESDGGDPGDVLEQFVVDGESDECEGRKVRRTQLRVRRRQDRFHNHHGGTNACCLPFSDVSTLLSTFIIFFRFFFGDVFHLRVRGG